MGVGAIATAVPPPSLLAGDRVHALVDHGVVQACLLHDIGHLLLPLLRLEMWSEKG
jgi:hypothetical protein